MNGLKVSIIIPVYNVEKYISKCVDSVINQTFTNLEILLIDDGSPDNCPSICEAYARKDKRITVIHKKNGGLSDARNYGLDKATGEFILFVDSDDYIRKDMCEIMINDALINNADIVMCNYYWVDSQGNDLNINNQIDNIIYTPEQYLHAYINTQEAGFIIACNKLYKREIFNDLRYPVGKINEDYFLIHKVVYRSKIISSINEKLYFYVQTENSIMRSHFTVKRMDMAEALYDQIRFAETVGNNELKQFAIERLSYELVKYKNYLNDKECLNRYKTLQRKLKFLAFEKSAWRTFPVRGRMYYRLEILFPNLMRSIFGIYTKMRNN